jgi:DNA invertase Pin-like site-specific DNA recombinase
VQAEAMTSYLSDRGWKATKRIENIGPGTGARGGRELLLKAARRREIDAIIVWRLDRWRRSVANLKMTLRNFTRTG